MVGYTQASCSCPGFLGLVIPLLLTLPWRVNCNTARKSDVGGQISIERDVWTQIDAQIAWATMANAEWHCEAR